MSVRWRLLSVSVVAFVGVMLAVMGCTGGEREFVRAFVEIKGEVAPVDVSGQKDALEKFLEKQPVGTIQAEVEPREIPGIPPEVGRIVVPVFPDNPAATPAPVIVIPMGTQVLGVQLPPGVSKGELILIAEVTLRQGTRRVMARVPFDAAGRLLKGLGIPPGEMNLLLAKGVWLTSPQGTIRFDWVVLGFDVWLSPPPSVKAHHTIPTAYRAKLPAEGSVIEDSFVEYTVDPNAEGKEAFLYTEHTNGEISVLTTVKTSGLVRFKAQPGGPRLGKVSLDLSIIHGGPLVHEPFARTLERVKAIIKELGGS